MYCQHSDAEKSIVPPQQDGVFDVVLCQLSAVVSRHIPLLICAAGRLNTRSRGGWRRAAVDAGPHNLRKRCAVDSIFKRLISRRRLFLPLPRRCKTSFSRCRAASRPCRMPLSAAVRKIRSNRSTQNKTLVAAHTPLFVLVLLLLLLLLRAQSTRWACASTSSRTRSAS